MPNIKVLFIEVDKVDQMAFERLVESENLPYDYKIAASFSEAKQILDSENFDAIITDDNLGDGTGLEILSMKTDAPVVMITGSGNEAVAVNAMKAGAYDYLVKDTNGAYLRHIPIIVEKAIKLHKTEIENERYAKESLSLANISSIIVGLPLSENIYDTICDIARTNLNVDLVWLGFKEKGSNKIIPISSASNEENDSKSAEFTWWDAAEGPSVNTLKTLQIQSVGDIESDTVSSPWKNEVCKMGYRSFLSLPMISSSENHLIGIITMYSRQSHFFEESAVTVFKILSNQASTAIETRQLIEGLETTVKEKTAELTNEIVGHKQTLEALREKSEKLEEAMAKIKVLSGLLKICSHCKRIRDEKGDWIQLEAYISDHSDTLFSHGICKDCLYKLSPEYVKKMKDDTA